MVVIHDDVSAATVAGQRPIILEDQPPELPAQIRYLMSEETV
jgi:hypothetical protein